MRVRIWSDPYIDALGTTGVYRLYDEHGRLLYVGVAIDPYLRVRAHLRREWGHEIRDVVVEWYPHEWMAYQAEREAIRLEGPEYNIIRYRDRSRIVAA